MDLKNIAYCKMNIDFDKELFIKEYDEFILPHSRPIANGEKSWEYSRELNKQWSMVDPGIYDLCDIQTPSGIEKRGIEQWMANSLIELITDNKDLLFLSRLGSVAVRNKMLKDGEYRFKETYEDLNITKWIKQLPIKKFIGVRCVSLKPGTFATIHKDENNFQFHSSGTSLPTNIVWEAGFISITLNISDGGEPLYYSVDEDIAKPFKANDPVYLFNDYCLHGVPVVSSRRRQIRVTGIPTEDLLDKLDLSTVRYL